MPTDPCSRCAAEWTVKIAALHGGIVGPGNRKPHCDAGHQLLDELRVPTGEPERNGGDSDHNRDRDPKVS
jgi:hypothetical protein